MACIKLRCLPDRANIHLEHTSRGLDLRVLLIIISRDACGGADVAAER
jgi:hypothetical protein